MSSAILNYELLIKHCEKLCEFRWERGDELHSLACSRVSEGELRRVQKLAAKRADCAFDRRVAHGVFAPASVSRVAYDRMACVCHVNSYLMCAPGFDLNLKQREFCISFCRFKDCMSRAARASANDGHARAVVGASPDSRINLAALLRHKTIN